MVSVSVLCSSLLMLLLKISKKFPIVMVRDYKILVEVILNFRLVVFRREHDCIRENRLKYFLSAQKRLKW